MFYQKGGGIQDIFRTITKPLAPVFKPLEPVYKPIAPVLNPILKEAAGIGDVVGANLLQNVLQDAIAGKSSKASAKAHAQQAKLNAKNMAAQSVVQGLFRAKQNGDGNTLPADIKLGTSSKIAERTPSKLPTKRKRSQSKPKKSQKKLKKQTGGSIIRRPAYRNGFESRRNTIDQRTLQALFNSKKQTGGRRRKNRKPRKQRRKPRKQRRKPQRGSGKKRKSRKQTERIHDIFS